MPLTFSRGQMLGAPLVMLLLRLRTAMPVTMVPQMVELSANLQETIFRATSKGMPVPMLVLPVTEHVVDVAKASLNLFSASAQTSKS